MKKPQARLCATALGLSLSLLIPSFICTPAHAVPIITLEPDDFAVGTDLTNAFDGVTLRRYTNDGYSITLSPVYAEIGAMAATGTQIFGAFWNVEEAWLCWRYSCPPHINRMFSVLLIQFDQPVSFVEVSGTQPHEGINALALDAYGNPVSQWSREFYYRIYFGGSEPTSWIPGYNHGYESLHVWTLGSTDHPPIIQTVLVGGFMSLTYVDHIRYSRAPERVPEPTSLLLLGVGLAGAAAWRRRLRL